MRRFAAPALSLLFPVILFAQTTAPSPQAPAAGASIIVTADRVSEPLDESTDSVTVITADQLQRSQATTVTEALRDVAGVTMIQSGSAGHATSAFIRGANSAQLLVLVDGVEVNNPFFGGLDLSTFLTSGIERIEIVRGPQSPLYGSEAMAGVINIITTTHRDGHLGDLTLEGGGMSTNRENLQLGNAADNMQWSLGAGHINTAGQFDNDGFRDVQLNGRTLWALSSASTFALHALYDDANIGIPFNGALPSPERTSGTKLAVGGADYTLHGSPLLDFEGHLSWTDRKDDFNDPLDPFSQTSADHSKLWRAMVQDTATVGIQTITFGAEEKHEDVTASSDGVPALDETTRTSALYAQDKFAAGALLFSVGGRWDHHSSFGGHFSPRLSAAYKLSPEWRLRAAAGSAFRAPSTGELAYPFYGNPHLNPETSRSYEGGLDFSTSHASASITLFQSKYRDLISFDPVTFLAANIERATISGAELTAGTRLSQRWRLEGNYTHLRTRDDVTGLPLFRRPADSGNITLTYDHDAWGAYGNLNAVGRRLETDFDSGLNVYNPGYAKVDAALFYRLRLTLKLTARGENLFDHRYAEALGFPATRRTFYGGLQFGF